MRLVVVLADKHRNRDGHNGDDYLPRSAVDAGQAGGIWVWAGLCGWFKKVGEDFWQVKIFYWQLTILKNETTR